MFRLHKHVNAFRDLHVAKVKVENGSCVTNVDWLFIKILGASFQTDLAKAKTNHCNGSVPLLFRLSKPRSYFAAENSLTSRTCHARW